MKKIYFLLIDAYAMIYRAYYAFIRTPRMNSRGENTSAIFGFVVTLDDLLKRVKPTHVGVAFDPHGPTFRHEAYEQYKAQREETPEDIRRAVPIIKDILTAMNIPILEVQGFEADDVIGTLSHKAAAEGFEVYMATPDKDYGQLVSDHIYMYRPRHTGGFEKLGLAEVCAKYGLSDQHQVIDLLGLMGDASDNIPGCKGIGEKTAVQLLQQFGSIENLLAHTDQLKGALQRKVQDQAEAIRFSRFLATIRTDVPIDFDAQALSVKQPDEDKLTPIYQHLEFNSLLKKQRTTTTTRSSQTPLLKGESAETGKTKKQKPVEQTLDLFADERPSQTSTSEEGNSEQPFFSHSKGETERISEGNSEEVSARLAAYLLNPEVSYNPNVEPDWNALKADKALWKLYNEVELPLVPVLREMEQAGVRIDVGKLHEAESRLTAELTDIEQQIHTLAGTTFNINSPRQVGDLLFDTLRLDEKAKKSKTGQYTTSEEVLQALKDKHPIVGKILAYRELKKLISTYIATLPSYIDPATGKIHTTYNQTVTATGRLSSSNPNLQTCLFVQSGANSYARRLFPMRGACSSVLTIRKSNCVC